MLTEGMYVADRYEIVGKIGAGGMSDVYKAKDHILGRFVAVKVLKQEFSEDVNFVTKFHTEAQSAAGLEHANIVNIYDVGSENGTYFIVMEYVEGITLKTYIEKKGQLSFKEAVSIAIQIGRGIESAHNKNIVHRDIKPQNVIISTEGKVKVTDFGIARAANSNTINSDVMGSVHYTSPEQARNGFVDGKSDIYSLGVVMYEMVTGRVPFDGDTAVSVAIQHLQEEMTPPSAYAPDLPISMEKIIQKCTQKNPDRRYETITDLLVDLKKVLISPNEDFVTMIPLEQAKTKIIPAEDVETIKRETSHVFYREEPEYLEDEDDEEDEEEEGILNPKMEKIVTILGIVAAVIIVIILIFILASFGNLFSSGKDKEKEKENITVEQEQEPEDEPEKEEVEKVTMISLVGKTEEEAREELSDLNLGLKVVGTEASDDYEEGEIIHQNISDGEEVEKNTTIEVTICSGPGEFEAPSVVGEDEDTADSIIREHNLVPKRDYAYSDTVPEGKIVSQSPEAGASVKKGDTITYVVSRGEETYAVPDVSNKTEEEAKKILTEAGFEVGSVNTEHSDTVPKGSVIRQSVTAGEYKAKGTVINLIISLGKETVYYSYEKTFDKPHMNATWEIELTKAESDEMIDVEVIDNGGSITIKAFNIADIKSGTLTIFWKWTSEGTFDPLTGLPIEPPKEEESTTGPLNVSFQQQ